MSDNETNKNLSTQKVLVAGYDPGWNDPPKWAYSGTQSTATTPTKRMLNKRVAFPLASTPVANKESLPSNALMTMPPLPSSVNLMAASHPPLVPSVNKDVETKTNELQIDKEQALNDTLANFETVIKEHVLDKTKAEEVRRRIDILKDVWLEDKLNNILHKKILDLSIALRKGEIDEADQIHVALMMQHASLCSSWISGIRHIILGLKTKLKNSSAMESENSGSELLPVERKE
ncbi:steroid receptor RNA activator 1-like isoform X2 [Colletes gigas]|uniref:steroid receptor RNA activator 1-like isoform X2 n=1 Tax=Colletes gigas TaxID=935657 RepID=UPI001C9B9905|nr:steroid receptor RNA activator 1-like isoform X2 [Colletes gigas]